MKENKKSIGYTEDEIRELENNESNNDEVQQMLELEKKRTLEKEVNKIFDNLDTNNLTSNVEVSRSVDEIKNNYELQNKVVNSFCENISSDINTKEKYAFCLIIILIIQFVALDVIFILVGTGLLKYPETTLNIFVSAGLLELIGLITIIVKYLFNDNITESLRIIAHINEKEK